jgi:hypothetical protein
MSDRPWWMIAGQWTLWAIVMALVMGWLARSRRRARRPEERNVLRYPMSILVTGILCFGVLAGIVVMMNLYPNRSVTFVTNGIFVGFAALAVPLMTGYFLERSVLSEEGLEFRNFLGMRRWLPWSELRDVRYVPVMRWFRLTTRSGTTARISIMLMGLPEFAQHLLRHAPPEALDEDLRSAFEAMVGGDLPPVW